MQQTQYAQQINMPMDAGRDDEVDDGDDQALLDENENNGGMDINHD